ncbi:MAG: hypothetical protein ACUVR0_10180 [Candidatus Aminicenantales bacterium]
MEKIESLIRGWEKRRDASKPRRRRLRRSFFPAIIGLSFFFAFYLGAEEGSVGISYWNRSRVYSFTDISYRNEYENILHLDLWQKTLNYGIFQGWFDGRISTSVLEPSHWYLNWQGFQLGRLIVNLQLGDNDLQLTKLGYRFTNYYPLHYYLRGVSAGFQHKKYGLDFFHGRLARLTGLFGNFYWVTDQTVTGVMASYEPNRVCYLNFGLVHTENEKSWEGKLLTRSNNIVLIESELRLRPEVKFVIDMRGSVADEADSHGKTSGTAIRFGPLLNRKRWSLEINYRRVEAGFKNISSEYLQNQDQEGFFAAWRYQPHRALFVFGAADYYHDNVDRLPTLNTTDFVRLSSGFSLISLPWPDLTFRLDLNEAKSRKRDESYRNFRAPGFYLQLAKNLGRFYPYFRFRLVRHDDRFEDRRDFTYPSFFVGLKYNYLRSAYLLVEAEDARHFDYRENKTFSYSRLRLVHYSPFLWSLDFYGEISYHKSWYFTILAARRLELYLGLSRALPLGFKVRVDLRASWPLESTLPANYWLTLKLDRRFNWGETPSFQGRSPGSIPSGTGRVEGLVFSDRNLNGVFDTGDTVFPGISLTLEDGSNARTDQAGRFVFPRAAEGLHTVTLEVRDIPAEYYLLAPERQKVVIEKRKTVRLEYPLVEGATLSGLVFLDSNRNGKLDEPDQALKDVLLVLKPLPSPALPEILEKMRTEEMTCYTDERGRFNFENILPGSYELHLDEETLPRGLRLRDELPFKIELKPGMTLRNLQIICLPRPVIFTGEKR